MQIINWFNALKFQFYYYYFFFFQKKRLKLNAEGEVIEGAEDDSSQMSDMHVTVIEPATGKFEI